MRHPSASGIIALAITAVLAMTPVALLADKGHEHQMDASKEATKMEAPKEVTLEGEVLDLYCFMNHPDSGQGMDHTKCAMSCINKGLPIGFLSDGEVYLIVGKEHESAAGMVAEMAGKQSRIKGTLMTHHGVKAIEIESIEKL